METEERTFHPDDIKMIEAIQSRNDALVSEFIREFKDKIFRLSMQYLRSEDEALDMVQEVFISIFEKVGNFQGKSRLSTWIYSVTMFSCLTYLRKKRNKKETFYEDLAHNRDVDSEYILGQFNSRNPFSDLSQQEDELLNTEAKSKLMQEIQKLPPDYKSIFIMKEFEGLSINEITKAVSLSVPAVKTRLHRARVYLRNKLVEYFEEFKEAQNG